MPAKPGGDDDEAEATTTPAIHRGGAAAAPLPSPWAPGTRFSSYEIESRLAAGGMAEVWRAKIRGLEGFEKRIVIKTMLTRLHQRPELTAMFVSEASLAARLCHPNIVDVLDFGQLEGRYFIAMEYVPGLTLRAAHRRMLSVGRRLPIPTVLHILSDVCEALRHVHDLADAAGPLGLIHRDLSPENVIVSTSGRAKLIDFGAARATARTQPGRLFVGKYRYAAPERIRNESEDRRSDVYSVGVILYECLVGCRPFEGSDADVIKAATGAPCCDPAPKVPLLPTSVGAVVRRATAQRPEDRFASARELEGALAACLDELGASSRERDVTETLSALLEPEAGSPPPGARAVEGVPELIEIPGGDDGELALHEREILEASGPLPRLSPTHEDQTERVSMSLPPEAFASVAEEPAVLLFDRGIKLRAEGRFGEALEAWERALALAPENSLYAAQVRRLRAQIASIGQEPGPG